MARDVGDDTYYKVSGGKIPVKWTAPEVSYVYIIKYGSTYVLVGINKEKYGFLINMSKNVTSKHCLHKQAILICTTLSMLK